ACRGPRAERRQRAVRPRHAEPRQREVVALIEAHAVEVIVTLGVPLVSPSQIGGDEPRNSGAVLRARIEAGGQRARMVVVILGIGRRAGRQPLARDYFAVMTAIVGAQLATERECGGAAVDAHAR